MLKSTWFEQWTSSLRVQGSDWGTRCSETRGVYFERIRLPKNLNLWGFTTRWSVVFRYRCSLSSLFLFVYVLVCWHVSLLRRVYGKVTVFFTVSVKILFSDPKQWKQGFRISFTERRWYCSCFATTNIRLSLYLPSQNHGITFFEKCHDVDRNP